MTQRRILVADDELAVRRTLEIALTEAGYQVLLARHGEEATRLWRQQGADLVIADIHMPDKNGLELIMELRAHSPSTPVIAITDGGRSRHIGILGDAKLLGAVRTLAKPFSLSEMLEVVAQELKGDST